MIAVDRHIWNPNLPLKYAKAMRFGHENWEVKYGEPVTPEHRAFVGRRMEMWFRSKAVVYDMDAIQAAQAAPVAAPVPTPARKSKYADVSAARAAATE